MKSTTIILVSAIIGYLLTDTIYLAAAYGGVSICVMAVYSLWKEEKALIKEQEKWKRLTTREREDRHMMLTNMAKLEQAKTDMGIDYVLDPKYKFQEKHRLMADENK